MKLLVLGGTQFIGRHIVEQALAGGHRVSVFNRGRSADPLPPQVERLRGDRDAGADGVRALEDRR
jgi:2'-hydroxyisoflavone reductase